jgi:hypothetical protein
VVQEKSSFNGREKREVGCLCADIGQKRAAIYSVMCLPHGTELSIDIDGKVAPEETAQLLKFTLLDCRHS